MIYFTDAPYYKYSQKQLIETIYELKDKIAKLEKELEFFYEEAMESLAPPEEQADDSN